MIYRQLRNARKIKGLSQVQLAAKVGAAQGYISNVEAGKVDVRLSNIIELARILDLEPFLVPRHLITLVRSIIKSDGLPEQKPRWSLDDEDEDD